MSTMHDIVAAHPGLRRRPLPRRLQDEDEIIEGGRPGGLMQPSPTQQLPPVGGRTHASAPRRGHDREDSSTSSIWKASHLYCVISFLVALLAITTSSSPSATKPPPRSNGILLGGPPTEMDPESTTTTSSSSSPPLPDDLGVQNIATAAAVSVVARREGSPATIIESEKKEGTQPSKDLFQSLQQWLRVLSEKSNEEVVEVATQEKVPKNTPIWLGWLPLNISPKENKSNTTNEKPGYSISRWFLSILDPSILNPSPTTPTDIIDKILTSTPRLVAIANLLLAITYMLHSAVADWFLGNYPQDWAGRERMGGFLVFKLLLISAVVAPDTLDLLILLSWYTLLSFLRSLDHLASATTSHTSQSGQPPRTGVSQLLLLVLLCDFLAAASCVALFHGAGIGMVLLLTCDCALLAVDVLCHILRHIGQVLDDSHATATSDLEEQQLRLHRQEGQQQQQQQQNPSLDNTENETTEYSDEDAAAAYENRGIVDESRELDRRMEILEMRHSHRLGILDTTVFVLQLFAHLLTVGHFLHIWSLHGVQFTLIDGVLALHLHSALSSASKKIAERRNLHKIARDMNGLFEDATEMELRKASASGDVCCICLGTMTTGNVKKVGCGHLYHAHCLREVVERARSIQAAKCPLCRASVLDGRHQPAAPASLGGGTLGVPGATNATNLGVEGATNAETEQQPQQQARQAQEGAGELALFRFSTEGIFPAWLPLPAFSFEVVRRPPLVIPEPQEQDGDDNDGDDDDNSDDDNNIRDDDNDNNSNDRNIVGANRAAEGEDNREAPRLRQQQRQLPAQDQQQSFLRRFLLLAGAIPMSPEEEARALEQLVDMFPQYERGDLLRELRDRGSSEAVVEAVLMGLFRGVARGD